MLLLVHNVHERNIKETGDRHIFTGSTNALIVICICVTTLHLCYTRMHLFSANQILVM